MKINLKSDINKNCNSMLNIYLKILLILLLLVSINYSQNNYTSKNVVKGNHNQEREMQISIYSNDIILFTLDKKLAPEYSIPKTFVLNNGNVVLVHSLEGIIEIYNSAKRKIYENNFYQLPPYNEQNLKIEITDKGLVVLVSENQINKIIIIDNNGKINSTLSTINGITSGLSASYDGNFIAISIFNWKLDQLINETVILDLQRNISTSFPIRFNNGKFNSNGNLFLAYTNTKSFFIDLIKQEILWENKLGSDHIYLDGTIKEDKVILIQVIKPTHENNVWIFPSAEILSFDIYKKQTNLNKISSSFEKLEFNNISGKLNLKIDDKEIQLKKN